MQPPFSFGQVAVIAIAPSGQSDAFLADKLDGSTGIFTTNSTGCGQGAILNVAPDGSVSPNSPANSASPGSFVSIYFTGLGRVNNPPADGYPSPANPPAVLSYSGYCAYFDGKCLGSNYVGRAPGFVGLDQVNAAIPYDVRQGCSIPVQIGPAGPPLISIRSGGGQCVDPPIGHNLTVQAPATAGTVTLQGLPIPGGGCQNPFLPSSNVEIDVEVGPDPATPQIVAAPGLTLGAVVTWKYQYRFVGLLVQ